MEYKGQPQKLRVGKAHRRLSVCTEQETLGCWGGSKMNRRKVRLMGKQPETLQTIFCPRRSTGRKRMGGEKKDISHRKKIERKKEATVIS